LPLYVTGSRAIGWWGTALLIANEAVLFASLIAGYFYLRFNSPIWPPRGNEPPELPLPLLMTMLLLASSAAMMIAERGIQHGNRARLRLGLAAAFVLAAIFISLQALEYSRTAFTPQQNSYTALFFTITGLHGLHVLVALLANLVLQIQAGFGYFNQTRHQAVQSVSLYWHFVDVVWIVVLFTVYLSPHL